MIVRLLVKFLVLVVATFLFVVLYDHGPTDYATGLKRNFDALIATLQSGS